MEDSQKIKDILLNQGYLNPEDFEGFEESGKNITDFLFDKEFLNKEVFGEAIAEFYGVKFMDLSEESIEEENLNLIPEIVAKKQSVVVFDKDEDVIKLAMNDPSRFEIIEWLRKKTLSKVEVFYATIRDIESKLQEYKPNLEEAFESIINRNIEEASNKLNVSFEDVSIIKIVDALIEYAYESHTSDIHIEPLDREIKIRYRIDGILHDVLTVPKELHDQIVTRVKVLSRLRTDKHAIAQDGSFKRRIDENAIDIRTSIVPITNGEKAVMRLLADVSRNYNLNNVGFSKKIQKKVKKEIKKPYGMILTTGPTGSGKTTTLYSVLKELNKAEVNISTIEDPVEYDIEGVNQIQVNEPANLSFASGLRSIVRQDPDIIMVGEVRDDETADIAVNSAMTGHLVLSTMHANTASGAFPRLIELGVEPFLTASSVNLVIAQRLVRTICKKCRKTKKVEKKGLKELGIDEEFVKKLFGKKKSIRVYEGGGCDACLGEGYGGRTALFEVLVVDEAIKKLIVNESSADAIEEEALKSGMVSMIDDGLEKVKQGITTVEEVMRTTK